MTLTVDLTPEEEVRLRRLADDHGVDVETALRELIASLPASETAADANAATIALLQAWREEDATNDPEEVAKAEAEWEELQSNLEANPVSLREWRP